MLSLTTAAADAIKDIVTTNDLPAGSGLRITAEEDGNEVSIELDFSESPEDEDDVVEAAGARVFLGVTAADVLTKGVLAVTAHRGHVHFEFNERGAEAV